MLSCPKCGIRFAPGTKAEVLDYDCFQELMNEGDFDGDYTNALADYRNISGLYERKRSDEEWGRLIDSPLFQEIVIEVMARYNPDQLKKIGAKIERRVRHL